jgi:hypothetical protein
MFSKHKLTVRVHLSKEERALIDDVAVALRRSCGDTLRVLALEKIEEMAATPLDMLLAGLLAVSPTPVLPSIQPAPPTPDDDDDLPRDGISFFWDNPLPK